jgi:uracil phosphoribosyltransferase
MAQADWHEKVCFLHGALTLQYPQVRVLHLSAQMKSLMTYIRDASVDREDFVFYADRIVRHVVEEGLAKLPCKHAFSCKSLLIVA